MLLEILSILLEMLVVAALALLHTVLSVAVHEGGHLVLGLATGYRFISYNVLGFVWAKDGDRIRLRRSKNSLVGGQCLLAPPEDEADFRYGWYNAGGGLFNFALAALLLPGALLTREGDFFWLFAFFVMGVVVNLFTGLMNLLPMSLGVPNDGLNLVTAAKSANARHALYLMLRVNGEVQAGKRFRDYPANAFDTAEPVNGQNYLESYILSLRAARLEDLGEHAAALACFDGVNLDKLNSYYATMIRIDRLYYFCVYENEPDEARALYAAGRVKRMLDNPMPTLMRVKAAVQFFMQGQAGDARQTLEKARALLEQHPSAGFRAMEADYMDELAEMMEADEQNSLD